MVVLATAIEPNPDVRKIATMLTASIDTNNFLTEAHAKLRPVESPTAGIFLSGVCQGPKDIPETVEALHRPVRLRLRPSGFWRRISF